jgi:hypothetical protein
VVKECLAHSWEIWPGRRDLPKSRLWVECSPTGGCAAPRRRCTCSAWPGTAASAAQTESSDAQEGQEISVPAITVDGNSGSDDGEGGCEDLSLHGSTHADFDGQLPVNITGCGMDDPTSKVEKMRLDEDANVGTRHGS